MSLLDKREWYNVKEIDGYDDYYITDTGLCFSTKKGKINSVPIHANPRGYYTLRIKGNNGLWKTRTVHRIVAKAFLDSFSEVLQVNHIDGDKFNNNISNLEMCTNRENAIHAHETGLRVAPRGSKSGNAKLKEIDVLWIRANTRNFSSKDLAAIFNVSAVLINIVSGWSVKLTWMLIYTTGNSI